MKAFSGENKPVLVHVRAGGQYVNGEWTGSSLKEVVNDHMTPRQITPQEERRLPDGSYKAGDMKFYAQGNEAKYRSGDEIEFAGIKYRIGDISVRHEGSFVIYHSKRVYGQ